jgi:hypothetical protein
VVVGSNPASQTKTNNMTLGEKIVRPDFAKTDEVKELKRQFVILIDKMDKLCRDNWLMGETESGERDRKTDIMRTSTKAIDHLEIAAMFAVKALTA